MSHVAYFYGTMISIFLSVQCVQCVHIVCSVQLILWKTNPNNIITYSLFEISLLLTNEYLKLWKWSRAICSVVKLPLQWMNTSIKFWKKIILHLKWKTEWYLQPIFGCLWIAFCLLFCQTTLFGGHEWMMHSTDSIFTFVGIMFKIYLLKCVHRVCSFHGLNTHCNWFVRSGKWIWKWNFKPEYWLLTGAKLLFLNEYYLFQWIL